MYSFGALVSLHNDLLRIMTTIFYDVPRESHCPSGLATNEAKMINLFTAATFRFRTQKDAQYYVFVVQRPAEYQNESQAW